MAVEIVKEGSNWKLEASAVKFKPGLQNRGMFRTLHITQTTGEVIEYFACHVMESAVSSIINMKARGGEVVTAMIMSFMDFQTIWVDNLGERCDDGFAGGWKGKNFQLQWRWIEQPSLEEYYERVGARSHWLFERHGSSISNAIWIGGTRNGVYVSGLVPINELVQFSRGQLLENYLKGSVPEAYSWRAGSGQWQYHPSMTPEMQRAIENTNWQFAELPTI